MGPNREKSRFTYLSGFGEKTNIPYFCFFIEGSNEKMDKKVIVDTGISRQDYLSLIKGEKDKLFAAGENFQDVKDITSFEDALTQLNICPEDIDMVIITHLHWDHVGNVLKCKNADIVVQELEWKEALSPHPLFQFAYAPKYFYEKMRRLNLINGDLEIFPGLKVVHTPGHTLGGQSVVINTREGIKGISGYCAIKENFYPSENLKKELKLPVIPPTVASNIPQAYESTLKLLQMTNEVLPSHDENILTRKIIG